MYHNLNKYILAFCLLLVSVFSIIKVNAQGNTVLKNKVAENGKVFSVNLDKGFAQIGVLLNDAVKYKDAASELVLLDRICKYHYNKNDVNKLIEASAALQDKAIAYKDSNYEAMSYVYQAEAYSMNGLYDKALIKLDKAIRALDEDKSGNPKSFYTKSNVLISQANIYNDKGDYKKAVEKLQLAVSGYPGKKNSTSYIHFQYVNYANLASIYVHFDVDSAEYYAVQSMAQKVDKEYEANIKAVNYNVLGQVNQYKKRYDAALQYYLKAEELTEKSGDILNVAELYSNMITAYRAKGDLASVAKYQNKLQEYELRALQSKYNSLHKELNKTADKETSSVYKNYLFILIGITAATLLLYMYNVYRKKKRQISDDEPDQNEYDTTDFDDYKEGGNFDLLIDKIKRKDASFIFAFEKIFPDFSSKLLTLNPHLLQSEIEFCAFLKMKLSTKYIAQLTFIEIRTVQNKKYRIRKKLSIPADTDIYTWFAVL